MNRSVRLAAAIIVVALPCVFCTCAGSGPKVRQSLQKNQTFAPLAECRSHADSVYVLETNELFAILDEDYWKDKLLGALSLTTWQERVDQYETRKGIGWWDEISTRLDYCRAQCATSIIAPQRDVRWELVLRSGIPSVEWSAQGESQGEDSTGTPIHREIFVYSWHEWGEEVVCQSEPGGNYPTRVISNGGAWAQSDLGLAITSHLSFAAFPNPDRGTFDVWVSSLTTGDQFTQASLAQGDLYLEFALFDSSGALADRDTLIAKLDLLRAFSGVTEARDLGVMGYLACRDLPAGEYTALFDLIGAGSNRGEYSKQIRLPSPHTSRGASDLVLTESRAARGPNVVPGIERAQRNLYVNPLAVFKRGDTLRPYMEFNLPKRDSDDYKVTVVAVPIRQDGARSKRSVSVGPIAEVRDVEGQIWGNAKPLRLDDDVKSLEPPDESNEIPLFAASYSNSNAGSGGVFDAELPLDDIGRGRYWIAVHVSDPKGMHSYGSAWAAIEVK
jgi:hypothetical protein